MKNPISRHLYLFCKCCICFFLVFCFALSGRSQMRIYVDSARGNDSYSGTSWGAAYRNITKALAFADTSSATEIDIWVAKGTYYPTDGIAAIPANPRDTSFSFFRGNGVGKALKLYGGFRGTETSATARDTFHRTILDGAIGGGVRSYHVVVITGLSTHADSLIVDGFTIQNGNADTSFSGSFYNGIALTHYNGAGVFMARDSSTKTVIRNCLITKNRAIDFTGALPEEPHGAGIYCQAATVIFQHCSIKNNRSGDGFGISPQSAYGGGLSADSSVCTFNDCSFYANTAEGDSCLLGAGGSRPGGDAAGGALFCTNSRIVLNSCVFTNDSANGGAGFAGNCHGGCIYFNNVTASISNCDFNGNTSNGCNSWGGCIYSIYSNLPLTGCHFAANSANGISLVTGSAIGGAMYNESDTLLLHSCTFNANSAVGRNCMASGGAVQNMSNASQISKCNFTGNFAFSEGHGAFAGAVSNTVNSRFLLDSCDFTANYSHDTTNVGSEGGALSNTQSAGKVTNCLFRYNIAESFFGHASGAGICNYQSSPVITNCRFIGNKARSNSIYFGDGGAIEGSGDTMATIIATCSFQFNRASQYGGAICHTNGKLVLANNNFLSDTAASGGAIFTGNALFSFISTALTGTGNVFEKNISYSGGGAIRFLMNGGTDSLCNNVFLHNKDLGPVGGGALRIKGDTHFISNNIFYGDSILSSATGGALRFEGTGGNFKVANNIFYKNGKTTAGSDTNYLAGSTYLFTGNSYGSTNPYFTLESNPAGPDSLWRTSDDGFHLTRCSPARNSGNDTCVPAALTSDITGAIRIMGRHVDMGAYEWLVIGPITGLHTICAGSSSRLTDTTAGGRWLSSDTAIARVDTSGLITGRRIGSCTIWYIVTDSCGSDTAASVVHIIDAADAGTITGTMFVCAGNYTLLSDTMTDGTWSATNSNATVSYGLVTGITPGIDTIVYTNSCGTGHAYAYVTIYPVPVTGSISGPTTVCTGGWILLTDTTAGGTWWANDSTVLVGSDTVHGITGGTATICYTTVNHYGCADTVTSSITVINTPMPGLITGYDPICRGFAMPRYELSTSGYWAIGDSNIATIDSTGMVTGRVAGSTVLLYTVTNSCGTVTDSAWVHVEQPASPIAGLSSLCVGDSITVTDSASGGRWSSSNTSIATISVAGTISGRTGGSAIISYMVINACGLSYTHNVARVDLPAGPIMGGDSVCLNATLTLSNIAAYGVWSVADPTIATINTSGVVTGIAAGSTKVYYYISNACGSFTDSQTVYVAQTPYCDSLAGWHLLMPLVVTVFPNPVSGIVHVSAPVPLNIEVSNMAGYIQQRRLHANEVDVNNLPTGVYLLRITDENGVLLKTERMVKIE